MSTTYSRDAIQFEADFAAHFFGLTIEEALSHEAVYFYKLQQKHNYNHNFDNGETGAWLLQYLPSDQTERQRILNKMDELHSQIHEDEVSLNHYNYEYTQFSKTYDMR